MALETELKKLTEAVTALTAKIDGLSTATASDDTETEEEEEEQPKPSRRSRRTKSSEDEETEEKPARKSRSRRTKADEEEEEEDEKPARKSRSSRRTAKEDDDEEEEEEEKKPARKTARKSTKKAAGPTQKDVLGAISDFIDGGEDADDEEERSEFVESMLDHLDVDKATDIEADDFADVLEWVEKKSAGKRVRFT